MKDATREQGTRRRRLGNAGRLLRWVGLSALLGVVALLGVQIGSHRYLLGINATFSMPEPALFLVDRAGWSTGQGPARGQVVAVRWHGGGPWPAGAVFVKRVEGVPGDQISVTDRRIAINGRPLAQAKTQARSGAPLAAIAAQVIPADHYYLHNDGPDSLDSRYALAGLFSRAALLGPVRVWRFR